MNKYFLLIFLLFNYYFYIQAEGGLPEYSEYLRNLSHPKLMANQPQFPSIQLCKEAPQNFASSIYCWIILILYTLIVLSLIVYQIRSIFWFKTKLPQNRRNGGKIIG